VKKPGWLADRCRRRLTPTTRRRCGQRARPDLRYLGWGADRSGTHAGSRPEKSARPDVTAVHAEFSDLPGLLDLFKAARTDLVELVLADEHSWDRYVAAHSWTLRQWLDSHPGDTSTPHRPPSAGRR
jgi:hypothetical protein